MKNSEFKNAVFGFVYHIAMDDATKQMAYGGKKSDIEKMEEIKACVQKYIDGLLSGGNTAFYETAKTISEIVGEDSEFTFGNIQKLINMTAKYMYILCYQDESLRDNFRECHCPMDSFMIRVVRKNYKELYESKKWPRDLLEIQYGNGKCGEDGSLISWSKIKNYETDGPDSLAVYNKYQGMVNYLSKDRGVYPIEYDYLMWKAEIENGD